MPTIAFDQSICGAVIKTVEKYIKVVRDESGDLRFKDMTCAHRGGPLSHGTEDADAITCPWHGKKTKKCRINYLDLAYVENKKFIWVGLHDFERIIRNF